MLFKSILAPWGEDLARARAEYFMFTGGSKTERKSDVSFSSNFFEYFVEYLLIFL